MISTLLFCKKIARLFLRATFRLLVAPRLGLGTWNYLLDAKLFLSTLILPLKSLEELEEEEIPSWPCSQIDVEPFFSDPNRNMVVAMAGKLASIKAATSNAALKLWKNFPSNAHIEMDPICWQSSVGHAKQGWNTPRKGTELLDGMAACPTCGKSSRKK